MVKNFMYFILITCDLVQDGGFIRSEREIHGKSWITRVWRQKGNKWEQRWSSRGRGYFSAASWPGARFVDQMLGLTDANVADIAGYC